MEQQEQQEQQEQLTIHLVEESDQPYVKVYCTNQYHYVWNNGKVLPKEVYSADDDVYYSFNNTKINCRNCLAKKNSL